MRRCGIQTPVAAAAGALHLHAAVRCMPPRAARPPGSARIAAAGAGALLCVAVLLCSCVCATGNARAERLADAAGQLEQQQAVPTARPPPRQPAPAFAHRQTGSFLQNTPTTRAARWQPSSASSVVSALRAPDQRQRVHQHSTHDTMHATCHHRPAVICNLYAIRILTRST